MDSYKEIRNKIQTGDTIAIHTSAGDIFGTIIRLAQTLSRKGYKKENNIKHVGVAHWIGDRLWLAEMDGVKNVLSPMSQHKKFTVYNCPIDRMQFEENLWYALENKITYNYLQLVWIILTELFNLRNVKMVGVVCSTFVIRIYKKNSQWGNNLSDSISPSLLCANLERKFEVRNYEAIRKAKKKT